MQIYLGLGDAFRESMSISPWTWTWATTFSPRPPSDTSSHGGIHCKGKVSEDNPSVYLSPCCKD